MAKLLKVMMFMPLLYIVETIVSALCFLILYGSREVAHNEPIFWGFIINYTTLLAFIYFLTKKSIILNMWHGVIACLVYQLLSLLLSYSFTGVELQDSTSALYMLIAACAAISGYVLTRFTATKRTDLV